MGADNYEAKSLCTKNANALDLASYVGYKSFPGQSSLHVRLKHIRKVRILQKKTEVYILMLFDLIFSRQF